MSELTKEKLTEILDDDVVKYLDGKSEEGIVSEVDQFQSKSIKGRVAVNTTQFRTWAPSNLHWIAPSHLVFYSDGTLYLYAKRISNDRNHGFGIGYNYTWFVSFVFFDANGLAVHSHNKFTLGSLDYKTGRNDAQATGMCDYLRDHLQDIRSVTVTRHIRRL